MASNTSVQAKINPDDYFDLPKPVLYCNMCFASLSGFFLNGVLFYLIRKKTPKEMQSYSRIMRVHCVSDMFFDLIQTVSGVQANPVRGRIYNTIHAFGWESNPTTTRLIISLYFWSLLFAIALLPIDFYFRFLAVCRNRDMSNRQLYFFVFLAYAITWEHAFINTRSFLLIGPTYETREYTQELQQFFKEKVPAFSVTLMDSYKTWINYGLINILITFVYGVIVYTFWKINGALKQNASVMNHQRAISIHKQVARLLFLQAVLPLAIICVPLTIMILLTLARFDLPHWGAVFNCFFIWLSAVKPLLTILIVPRYRNHIRLKICGGPSRTAVNPNTLVTSDCPGRPISTIDASSERENRYVLNDQQNES